MTFFYCNDTTGKKVAQIFQKILVLARNKVSRHWQLINIAKQKPTPNWQTQQNRYSNYRNKNFGQHLTGKPGHFFRYIVHLQNQGSAP